MSFVILIILFIAGLIFSINKFDLEDYEIDKKLDIENIVTGICFGTSICLAVGTTQLMDFSVIRLNDPGLTITIDDNLIEEYKLKLAEDEEKEDRRFYISQIIDFVKFLLTYILGLFSPYIAIKVKRFLIKRKKKRKKRKREKEELKRKNQ